MTATLASSARCDPVARGSIAVLACGALAREVLAIVRMNEWAHVDVRCLPMALHLRPDLIAPAVDAKLRALAQTHDAVYVAYADCGTSGALDRVLEAHGARRLPGAHCYASFAGEAAWQSMQDEEPGTFYLTDFLVRHFDALVVRGLGLDRHPDLREDVFAHYRRLVYLAQSDNAALRADAAAAAAWLGLELEVVTTGYGTLESGLADFVGARA